MQQLTTRHQAETRALEERLNRQHQEQLKAAVDAAKAEVAPVLNGDQQATVDAAIEARVKELGTKHEEEIAAAVERGRLEAGAKFKLKDAQLVRAQNKVKELETELQKFKGGQAGAPVAGPSTTAAPTKPAPAPAAAPKAPANPAARAAAAAAQQKAGGPSGLPQRPPGAPGPAGRGRGGAVRGTGRGGAPALAIRGAAPAGSTPSPDSTGVSIIGAAGKRAREDGDGAGEDSLAKRLKPEGASKPPVQIRRPPPPAPS